MTTPLDAVLTELEHADGRVRRRAEPAAFQDLYSHADDVTIFGAFGGHEQGWDTVGPRLAWAASPVQAQRADDQTGAHPAQRQLRNRARLHRHARRHPRHPPPSTAPA